jgi:predicted PurR-regulated permease PerM
VRNCKAFVLDNVSNNASKDIAAKTLSERSGPTVRTILRVIIVILAVLIVLWIISKLTAVILLLVLSIFFAYLVSPLVEFIRRPRRIGSRVVSIPKVLAILLAYLLLLATVVIFVYGILPSLGNQFPEFWGQAKIYWKTLGDKSQQLIEYSGSKRMPEPVVKAINKVSELLALEASNWGAVFLATSITYLAFLPWLILIPLLAFFLLKDAESFRRSALQMLPRGRWRWRGDEFFQDVNETLAAYIRAQLTACLFVAVVCALGFTVLGLPGGLVMGLIAGVFEFIPLVGPLTIAIMAALLAVFHAGPLSALLVLIFLGVLRIAQDYFIYPRLIGQGIHLHPLAVIFAILAGAELAGVAGIFLAIPVVAVLTVSYRHWLEHRGSEGLADLLEPGSINQLAPQLTSSTSSEFPTHPGADTTSEEMARARPDLTTGELKMPVEE